MFNQWSEEIAQENGRNERIGFPSSVEIEGRERIKASKEQEWPSQTIEGIP
jgi:hypothetical protein